MGDVVLMDFLSDNSALPKIKEGCDIFVSLPSDDFWPTASKISRELRAKKLSVVMSLKSGSFKNQLKFADRSQARWTILFGEEEWKENKILLRDLKNSSQEVITLPELFSKTFV